MRNTIKKFLTIILCSLLFHEPLLGQTSLTENILSFEAECEEPIEPEKPFPNSFKLRTYQRNRTSTKISFDVINDCGSRNQGKAYVSGDTLIIHSTDIRISKPETTQTLDSLGMIVETTIFTEIAEISSCECLINYTYVFAMALNGLKYLKFHNDLFALKK